MQIKTPLTYLRHRRDQKQASKPTTHSKIAEYSYLNPQIQSSLFTRFPGEIRELIYQYALLASPDPKRPFCTHSYHYRPGYTHARHININFLLTCRKVYLEAGHLAVSQNEHLIYQPTKHGPPGHRPYLLPSSASPAGAKRRGLLKLTQRAEVQRVHIFAQQYWLEDWNMQWYDYCNSWSEWNNPNGEGGGHPPELKITIRHTDWWYYLLGENSPLALDPKKDGRAEPRRWIGNDEPFMKGSWGSRFKLFSGLEIFELELETLASKCSELNEVVEQAYGWRFPLKDGDVLVCEPEATSRVEWVGSKHFKGLPGTKSDPTPGLSRLQGRSGSTLRASSVAATITLPTSPQESESSSSSSNSSPILPFSPLAGEDEDIKPADRLYYYVVTLTYRAKSAEDIEEEQARLKAEKEEEEAADERRAASAAMAATTEAPAIPTNAVQGFFTPAPWVPRREGFPTAYG